LKIRYGILIPIALLGILFLAGSASAAVDFPADEAGISAYVKAKDSIDLNQAKSAFVSIERETSNYVIGTVALTYHSEEEYPHVYVSNDGWVVAYYPRDKPSSWLFPWAYYSGGSLGSTTLSIALGNVVEAVGGVTNGMNYYDFEHPDASKMMIILESATSESNFFTFNIPTTYSMYVADWSHYSYIAPSNSYSGSSKVYFDGTSISSFGEGKFYSFGSLTDQIVNGKEHKLEIYQNVATGRIGLVLEYAE